MNATAWAFAYLLSRTDGQTWWLQVSEWNAWEPFTPVNVFQDDSETLSVFVSVLSYTKCPEWQQQMEDVANTTAACHTQSGICLRAQTLTADYKHRHIHLILPNVFNKLMQNLLLVCFRRFEFIEPLLSLSLTFQTDLHTCYTHTSCEFTRI